MAESEELLPPLLVHRRSMRVIDGMHRLRVAQLRGDTEVEVRFVDGDEASLFVLAVQANIAHGLPLSLADRKTAAGRIIGLYPEWSDRMIASVAGISAKTAGVIRRRLTVDNPHLDARLGRDGRARPVNGAARRAIAARVISDNPGYTLREIARAAGISPETARSVLAEIRGESAPAALSATRARQPTVRPGPADNRPHGEDAGLVALRALQADPACRANERTRLLLRILSLSLALIERGDQLVEGAPLHCLGWVVDAARACSHVWAKVADQAADQRRRSGGF